jgi:hypothetical protein
MPCQHVKIEDLLRKADTYIMAIFGSKEPKIRVIKQGKGKRVLDFSEFMDKDMKQRIRKGVAEFMDQVANFEYFYMDQRISEGWVLTKGGRNDDDDDDDDRFKVTWQVGGETIVGTYDDGQFTVTENLKSKKT